MTKEFEIALRECGLRDMDNKLVKIKNTESNLGMKPALALFVYARTKFPPLGETLP